MASNRDDTGMNIGRDWKAVRLDRRFDWVGPPHKIARIRPVKIRRITGETATEITYRAALEDLNDWNCRFWMEHNVLYDRHKQKFIEKKKRESSCFDETNCDLSEFYKKFIDERYNSLANYNREWHKRNFLLLWPAFKVNFIRLRRFLKLL